jgi:hypothetical protein
VSDYVVLSAVSSALRDLIWGEFQTDAVLGTIVTSEADIVFTNPTQTAEDASKRLSLWLYRVEENEFLKNHPLMPADGNRLRHAPLALNLTYLLTPFGDSGEAEHLLLGKAMQVLFDNPIVILADQAAGVFEELRIVLARLTLDELTGVWQALREPYRLSLAYQVRVTRIDSLREVGAARVVDRAAGFGETATLPEAVPA